MFIIIDLSETPEGVVKWIKFVQRRAREMWIKRLTPEADLLRVMEYAATDQIEADNRAKPVGLFLNRDDIMAMQDEPMPH